MKIYWITDEQLAALEENKLNETADEAAMWQDTMRDVADQHMLEVNQVMALKNKALVLAQQLHKEETDKLKAEIDELKAKLAALKPIEVKRSPIDRDYPPGHPGGIKTGFDL